MRGCRLVTGSVSAGRTVGVRAWLSAVLLAFVLAPWDAGAVSARDRFREGMAAYARGDFEAALSAFREAEVDLPESPHIAFNRGLAYYGQGKYDKAEEQFQKAALKTRQLEIEAKAKFNLGNCAFRESERQRDSDLKKSLAACEKSVQLYQEALELQPGFEEAAENIEVVRLVMKSILDDIKKQEEASRQQQQKQQQAAEKLKELLERQRAAAGQTRRLDSRRKAEGDSPETRERVKELTDGQDALREETAGVAQAMDKAGQGQKPDASGPIDKARQHVGEAVERQGDAVARLREADTETAPERQDQAAEALEKALKALSGGQEQQGPQQGQQEQQGEKGKAGEKQESQKAADRQAGQDREGEQDKLEQALVRLQDEARDILDEEEENRERRRVPSGAGYRPVEKDW